MSKAKKAIMLCAALAVVLALGASLFLQGREKAAPEPSIPEASAPEKAIPELVEKPGEPEPVVLKELPKPEITGGARGELGIDRNINESTIDEYLGREDCVYRDMRMLEDPGNYEAIGGDRFLSGYIEGFEIIPLPYIIPVTGLPSEVGDTYTGTTLFRSDNGTYVANYEESMEIIERIFPKNKVIFLMCGGGGYAGMTRNFLVTMGWDENKLYNIGGYWYYEGAHSVAVGREIGGVVSYDFDSVPYHAIDFDKLTKSADYQAPYVKVADLIISTSQIELEEFTSFQLNVITLPNEASNKELTWTSSDYSAAYVSDDGLVYAVREGTAVVTAQSVDSGVTVSCDVVVNRRAVGDPIELDDVSEEAAEFASYDYDKIYEDYYNATHDSAGNYKDGYSCTYDYITYDLIYSDLLRAAKEEYEENVEQAITNRASILDQLVDAKKSFVILFYTESCEARSYSVIDGATKILEQYNCPYLFISHVASIGDEDDRMLEQSKLAPYFRHSVGSVIIVKDGEPYVSLDPDADSIKSDEELINWLSKYIRLEQPPQPAPEPQDDASPSEPPEEVSPAKPPEDAPPSELPEDVPSPEAPGEDDSPPTGG